MPVVHEPHDDAYPKDDLPRRRAKRLALLPQVGPRPEQFATSGGYEARKAPLLFCLPVLGATWGLSADVLQQ